MSNSLAIAATTAALRNLLLAQLPAIDTDLGDLQVTVKPPDQARAGITQSQLNIFLYQVMPHAGWSNLDTPRQVRPGEVAIPPLALNLHYLITAYGRDQNDDGVVNHRVLGGAMSALYDHPLLGREELALALAGNDVGGQFERLRITQLPLPIEELSKLWTVFQTQYRVSAAYEVTVALIDSRRAAKAAPPVLSRGVASTPAPLPVLVEVQPPFLQPAAMLGQDIEVLGRNLGGSAAVLRFTGSRLAQPVELAPLAGAGAESLSVHLPDPGEDPGAMARWAPGFHTCTLSVPQQGAEPLSSTPVAFALAPRITVSPNAAAAGTLALTMTCAPRLVAGQRVLLILGERQVAPASIDTPADVMLPSTLAFSVPDVAPGMYLVRLRVDGVDSIPVIQGGALPAFDPAQKVTVT